MSNFEGSIQLGNLEDGLHKNPKDEIIIDIDEAPIFSENVTQLFDSGKDTEQYSKKNKNKEVTSAINNEHQNTFFEMGDKPQKSPDIWVQFLQGTKNRPGKKIDPGRRSGRNYHYYQEPVGSALDYDPEARNGFVLIVFAIVLVMLMVTFIYVAFIMNTPGLLDFYRVHRRGLGFLSSGTLIAMSYIMICCLPIVRVPPCNFVALFIVVAAMSNLAGVCTAVVKTHIIFFCLLATSITVALCILLALSKFDFTAWYLYVIGIGCVLLVLSLSITIATYGFGLRFRPLVLIILYISTAFQIFVLILELQMILGGKSIELTENEYILAAYMLYTSVANLFLLILQILADLESS